MNPSVLFVDQSADMGGGELSLFDLIRNRGGTSKVVLLTDGPFRQLLTEAGISVEVVSANASMLSIGRGTGLRHIAKNVPALTRIAREISILARGFDLIYANSQKAFILASLASFQERRPLIWHLRDMLTPDHFSWLNRTGVSQIANFRATRVIVNSFATASALKAAGGRSDKIRVVHNGIGSAPFDAIDADVAERKLRAELHCGDATLVGSFSRLAEWKGQHILLQALVNLPSIHGVFVGGSLFGETAYEQRLKDTAYQMGLHERVHFLGFRSDVPALMKAVDIVVHTSIAPEPFGRVIVEGMLAGKPVVAACDGGVVEIVNDGSDGMLVPPGNPKALASAIAQLTSNSELAARLGARGRMTAKQRFSMEACSAGVESIIAEASRS